MRAIGKYDLLETIVGGAVEVFAAEEMRTRLRRLVCIVPSNDDPTTPTTHDILQAFRRLAPDPPGVILDSGKDQASRSVYLVTSFPSDPLAIETWVQAYRAFTEKRTGAPPIDRAAGLDDVTQAWTSGTPPKKAPVIPERPKQPKMQPPPVVQPPAQHVGEFTRMFHESGPVETARPTAKESTLRSHFGVEPVRPSSAADELFQPPAGRGSNNKPAGSPGSFTREFFAPAPAPPEEGPRPGSHAKTGEFTKFFRGGMGAPPEQPLGNTDNFPAPASGKPEGEFTKMFDSPSEPMAKPEPGFTPVFDRGGAPQGPASFTSQLPQDREPELSPRGGRFGPPKFEPTNVDRPFVPVRGSEPAAPPNAVPRPRWDSEEKSEPSRVFNAPPAEPVVSRPVAPAGPSEFTRIISGGLRNAPPPPVDVPSTPAVPPPAAAAFPAVAPPALATPQAPAMPQAPAVPQTPAIPQVPQVAVQAPAAQQIGPAPQASSPAQKPASYLPLIIVLNVVLIAAVALILYFVLKPH